ncbi:MAG: hypothetical protein Q8R92_06070 [Deltaproteobacteria bacterium]|nr:hypothetical protein [Deltaproteobacteria bacterium]
MIDVPFEFRIWDAAECAAYFGQSKEYFLRRTRHVENFPAPVKMSEGGQPRWRALAVAQWAVK